MKNFLLTVALGIFSTASFAQSYNSYYYDYKLLNPALAGNQDKHIITTVYAGFPSANYSSMYYGTYETSIPSSKSGVGARGHYQDLGVISSIQGGLFYSKQLSFNDNAGLRIGTQLTFNRQQIHYDRVRPIELSDPLILEDNGVTRSVNLDLGLLYYSRIANIGIGVKDFFENDEMFTQRVWSVIASREFNIAGSLKITPSLVYLTDSDDYRFDVNSIFEIKTWILIGGGYSIREGDDDVTASAGLNVKDWVQIIAHVYASSSQKRFYSDDRVEVILRANIPHRKKATKAVGE